LISSSDKDVGREGKIGAEQKAMLARTVAAGGYYSDDSQTEPESFLYGWTIRYEPPFLRRLFGVPPIRNIALPYRFPAVGETFRFERGLFNLPWQHFFFHEGTVYEHVDTRGRFGLTERRVLDRNKHDFDQVRSGGSAAG
jgi:hypothetical protein